MRLDQYLRLVADLISKAESTKNYLELARLCTQAIGTLGDARRKAEEEIDK